MPTTYCDRVIAAFHYSGKSILTCAQIIIIVNNLDISEKDIKARDYMNTLTYGIAKAVELGYITKIPVTGIKTKIFGHNYQLNGTILES